jgi:hypothetical protein
MHAPLLPRKSGGRLLCRRIAVQIGQPDMPKHRPSPSRAAGREQLFDKLLAAIGAEKLNHFLQVALVDDLRQIEGEYTRRVVQLSKLADRKLLRRQRAAVAKLLTLSKKVGADSLAEIEEAGWSRHNPGVDIGTLHAAFTEHIAEHGLKRRDLIADLTALGSDMDHWLKTSGETYKKRYVTKLLVEPFLRLMAEYGITTSRKQLPRSRMFQALFEWLGVEQKFRLSGPAINAIAKELAGASASKSNARRRTKN